MIEARPKTIGRIRLFEELLGIAPTKAQNTIACALEHKHMVAAQIDLGEERTILIAACCLWTAYLGRARNAVVYTDTDERAREITAMIRRLHENVPRSWSRPIQASSARDENFIAFAGAGTVTTGKVRDHISIWHDLIIIDGADNIELGPTTNEVLRYGRETAPDMRILALAQESDAMMSALVVSGSFTVLSPFGPVPQCDPVR